MASGTVLYRSTCLTGVLSLSLCDDILRHVTTAVVWYGVRQGEGAAWDGVTVGCMSDVT